MPWRFFLRRPPGKGRILGRNSESSLYPTASPARLLPIPPGGIENFFGCLRKSPIQKAVFLVYWYYRACILMDMNFEEVVTYECID